MSKLIVLIPGQPAEERDIGNTDPVRAASAIINDTMDFTRVKWKGKLRTMAVGDTSTVDGLPHNEEATKAYHANCIPGTVWPICGTAVIFETVLR